MILKRTSLALIVSLVWLLGALPPATAAPRGANRALEKIFERSLFTAQGSAQIARAYKVAVDAGVEERDALELVEACSDGEFGADQTTEILTIAAQIALERLPTEVFLSKIKEGVAKHVEADLVVQAARRQAVTLKQASNILKALALEGLSQSDWGHLLPDIAEALVSGMDQARIRGIITEVAREGGDAGDVRRKLFP